jgi:hypothetical protein
MHIIKTHTHQQKCHLFVTERRRKMEDHKFLQQKYPPFLRKTEKKETEAFKFSNKTLIFL